MLKVVCALAGMRASASFIRAESALRRRFKIKKDDSAIARFLT
jgi:hypothetical protein